ncbi:MAG: UvrABC system protein A [Thermotoga sp. 47_83]|uniref:UvrABC system protein A n=1 Tax=Thermotoga petrophila TaxID=93929 RepID=A0A124FG16_9THEM|nr:MULTISPECIES: excinuclease ABC subunit UvrA [unclassified Thermotoga]KUK23214.1 MAG: UvrABC system protein A [Thermotoga petrophila]KUK33219.1 MAG: UvrABC system protein A [Thermotoga sp. 47_83]AIY87806.1 excinuclease ABC subunit A [Thermotoga sp. Cell2]KAF2960016.1 ABC-ATPase UvrA [Thermotoga sp. 38H-to]KHC90508.1 excinuclease ABC subunit A [Thermotoga sp. Mc24]
MNEIVVKGARIHNLKNITVRIPKNRLVVITGVSGSGKSSLAMDTIYAEGQRRYLESLSTYARQFLGNLKKPDVDEIEGLSPAIAIDQKTVSHNPRSTVGTVTEIYDYLRVLYARIGKAHCPECGRPLEKKSIDEILQDLFNSFKEGSRIYILAPVATEKKGTFKKEIEEFISKGFARIEIDGEIYRLEEVPELDKNKRHTVKLVVDRLILETRNEHRILDSLELAMREGKGFVEIRNVDTGECKIFSENLMCPVCGIGFPEITPKLFSFNSPYGACPNCHGLGFTFEVDPSLVIDEEKSVLEGAIIPYRWDRRLSRWVAREIEKRGVSPHLPFKDLPEDVKEFILYGDDRFEGVVPKVQRWHRETESPEMKEWLEKNFIVQRTCSVCGGKRLNREALSVKINGLNIHEFTELSISEELEFLKNLNLTEREREIVGELLKEIEKRLEFLVDVGLEYLTLSRSATTLSGGESQRIRLATQIGSGLTGVIYVLDEPTIGLHPRDTERLIKTLKKLRDLGNTVIVVEHDEEVIRNADHIIDIGPGGGTNGGRVVFQGTVDELLKNPDSSLTGEYLSGKRKIAVNKTRRLPYASLKIKGVRHNNLKNIDVEIPLGVFVCVTGVSGSGKSSLVMETLYPALMNLLHKTKLPAGEFDSIEGHENIDKVIAIDQSPIGRTPRSNPATYTKVFDEIRSLFAMTPAAKARGYTKSRFSFNLKGGRCEACQGQGYVKIEMLFLPDVYVECDVCKGKRYNRETLEITYKGKNISDILDMTVDEALEFFKNIPSIKRTLQVLHDVGLGYVKLGQPATTLSGGEAQRIKLASELRKRDTGRTLYILDEPTVGLHFEDVRKLVEVLHRLVDRGNTVIVIEHNLDVIKNADHIIDLGPEGGKEGGYIVATGTPEEIAKNPHSYTGRFLKNVL